MSAIETGNVLEKQNGSRGWIMGDFTDNPLPYPFNTSAFEVKWAHLTKGEKKEAAASDSERQTLTILVKGKQQITFPETGDVHLLEKEGDYVFFEPGVMHSWEAIEDNLTITIRWIAT